jgi:hypothetical protein
MESMLSCPWAPRACAGRGEGKWPSASIKGGSSSTPPPAPEAEEFGEMDRMPTMMMGTIRCSPPLDASPCASWLSDPPGVPNRNMRKKLRGPDWPPSPFSGPSPPCLSADAILPFCKALRNPRHYHPCLRCLYLRSNHEPRSTLGDRLPLTWRPSRPQPRLTVYSTWSLDLLCQWDAVLWEVAISFFGNPM